MQVFLCGGERQRCSEPSCREVARRTCGFLLQGAKAGQPCGRLLCERHFHPRPDVGAGVDYCPAHQRLSPPEGA